MVIQPQVHSCEHVKCESLFRLVAKQERFNCQRGMTCHAGEDRFVCTKQFDRETKQLTDLPSSRGHPSSSEPAQPADKVSRKLYPLHYVLVNHIAPFTVQQSVYTPCITTYH